MSDPSPLDRQRRLLRDLARFDAEQAEAEPALAASFREEKDRAEQALEVARETLSQRCTADKEALDESVRRAREAIEGRFALEQEALQKEYSLTRWGLTGRFDAEKEAAEAALQEARFTADAVLEGGKTDAVNRLRKTTATLNTQMDEMRSLFNEGRILVEGWRQPARAIEEAVYEQANAAGKRPLRKLADCLAEGEVHLQALRQLSLPRWLGARRVGAFILLLWLALVYPLGTWVVGALQGEPTQARILGLGAVSAGFASLLIGLTVRGILAPVARRRVEGAYVPLCEVLVAAESSRQQWLARYQAEHDQELHDTQQRHAREQARARACKQKLEDVGKRRVAEFAEADRWDKSRCAASEQKRADALRDAEQRYRQGCADIVTDYERDLQELEEHHSATVAEIEAAHLRRWRARVDAWQRGLTEARAAVGAINEEMGALFPPWDDPSSQNWEPPQEVPPAARFGSLAVRARQVVPAVPWQQGRPTPAFLDLQFPALCASPEPLSLLLHARDEGRERAVGALQTILFRLLTAMPAGRVRFVIVDPVGLGQNFAAFMNLADHDENLVGSRIWTEATHIEQRLADLTAHMENVIQKYLRNRYNTISEYNAQAGEVAEPFRVLVVANFPVNFTVEAARRLVSIAQSGPRCGVSTLLTIDSRAELPKGFDLTDLEQQGLNLDWLNGGFRWRDEDFRRGAFAVDGLPDAELCNRVLVRVGEAARGAHRIEVPFDFIAPPPERWWAGSTRQGVSVPLGRAGATRRQMLELGKGTSQHALIVGKTGSGKSTLLHALITNLALLYNPDEVELYLVDFKKGVEFKTYAVHELPHARVVAIESEREFGLSVLQRLDAELKRRGERFRAAGAQDLNSYRKAAPETRSPRILLIVDEFQEFFVDDDRIAQEAAQLLDRLVRQGRAFGMHVLLGSQTIGGAYSLARSTIDQMAVRIALQCSEADAHLVLSDDNSAARLLSRPGEAIYNDANGLLEGNDLFQVVWLGEDQREQYLKEIHQLDEKRPTPRLPTVVFEGNADADVSKNVPLNELLASPAPAEEDAASRAERAWLGEAMAIDELTAAVFRRQNGSNLLIVGQQPEAALGMLATGAIGLAAHPRPAAHGTSLPRFFVLDGHQAEAPRTGPLAALRDVLAEPVRLGGWRDLGAVLAELTAELERRQQDSAAPGQGTYLILYGLQRFRDLRRQDDDFGFMSRGEERAATPDKMLATLLREGAALGLHTLMWCDTLNNLQRALDRQAMHELAMRVVFQLSVADSSNLIDSPAASKLGLHRALFASEEEGRLEKFRPYGVPSAGWLSWVREQLRRPEPAPAKG
jgi:hypothetical protein